ncbi:hypothetical protein PIB30_047703 [Stylosanthes scabra]|uniref:Uncharacterized protein n=1 Tax=Stylosanthes scabra TaxID=79078 RepID=A0ABU6SGL4_9FABA|nr:hypothetical protein [Stylosanthes scabra]
MHQSPSDSKGCMKVEEVNPVKKAPPNKSSKKKSKEDKGKSITFEDTPTASYTPYPSVLVGSDNNASSKDRSLTPTPRFGPAKAWQRHKTSLLTTPRPSQGVVNHPKHHQTTPPSSWGVFLA